MLGHTVALAGPIDAEGVREKSTLSRNARRVLCGVADIFSEVVNARNLGGLAFHTIARLL